MAGHLQGLEYILYTDQGEVARLSGVHAQAVEVIPYGALLGSNTPSYTDLLLRLLSRVYRSLECECEDIAADIQEGAENTTLPCVCCEVYFVLREAGLVKGAVY